MNERDQILVKAIEAIFGVSTVTRLGKLLQAARSKNDVADLVRTAIESKVKSETARLEGIVLLRMAKDGLPEATQAKVRFALGIGSQTESAFDYASITAEPAKAQAKQ